MIRNRTIVGLTTALLLCGAGLAAQAQSAPQPAPMLTKIVWTENKPVIDLTDQRLSLATPYAQRSGPVRTGNKTAIDHQFADQATVGSVGYLCGLKPGPNESGGVASAYDAAGTFLGGQLKIAW